MTISSTAQIKHATTDRAGERVAETFGSRIARSSESDLARQPSVNDSWLRECRFARDRKSVRARIHTVQIHLDVSAVAALTRQLPGQGQSAESTVVIDWFSGAISPMTKCWTTNAGSPEVWLTACRCLRIQ
jgi:hypothetical protein